jgi:hypothetical protein
VPEAVHDQWLQGLLLLDAGRLGDEDEPVGMGVQVAVGVDP